MNFIIKDSVGSLEFNFLNGKKEKLKIDFY